MSADPGSWPAPLAGSPVRGVVVLPGSKSLTNRELVLAALAAGPSVVRAPLRARDTLLMAEGLRTLGARVDDVRTPDAPDAPDAVRTPDAPDGAGEDWRVTPGALATGPAEVDCGLAGTVARFLPPLAALGTAPIRFDGDPRMRERPMSPLLDALRALGADVDADRLPMVVRGPLLGGTAVVDASTSSQLVSGLLLAGPAMPAGLDLRHVGPPAVSLHHIAMTVALLRSRGVVVDDTEPGRWAVAPGPVAALDRTVEPDLSSASAFLAAAAATAGRVQIPGWPMRTTQPGAVLPDLLTRMGAGSTLGEDGLVLTGPDRLTGLVADLRDAPELVPALAALAVLAQTPSRLTGVAHLRLQESDRLAALAEQLGRLGADIRELPDGLEITPAALSTGGRQIVLDPYADHRLAMAYAVVGLVVPGVAVADVATTGKTVPHFTRMWAALTGTG